MKRGTFMRFMLSFGASLIILVGCGDDSSTDDGTDTDSSISITGTACVGEGAGCTESSSLSLQKISAQNALNSMGIGALAATQCPDGFFYSVYCVSFSSPPVAGEGFVDCTGDGSFTVSGMPTDTAFGCFVRRYEDSTDSDSAETVGTVEIPSTSGLSGTTDSISSNGSIAMSITVGDDGSITAEVTSGTVNDGSNNTIDTTLSGIYQMTCATSAISGTTFNQTACKCFLDEDVYDNQDECFDDNAALITTAPSILVDFQIYKGTLNSNVTVGNGQTLASGSSISAVTVWDATGGTTSRVGSAEGLPTFNGAIDWDSSSAEADITFATSITPNDGTTINLTGALALPDWRTASVGDWQDWIAELASAAKTNGDFSCTFGDNTNAASVKADANCLAEFSYRFLEDDDVNLPRIRLERICSNSGCDSAVANSRVIIEGVEFNYSDPWSGNQSAVTVRTDSIGPSPSSRYVLEQWIPFSGGGGGFTQKYGYEDYQECTSGDNAACSGGNDAVFCRVNEELSFKMIPDGSNALITFDQRSVVIGARPETTGTMSNAAAMVFCKAKVQGQDATFLTNAVKQ